MADGRTTVVIPPGAPLRITSRSGRVTMNGEARDDVLVERGASDVTVTAGGVEIARASGAVAVRCPLGTDVLVGVASGGVALGGTLGDARVTTESGDIVVGDVARLDARSRSGSIRVARCAGECRCRAASGHVRIDEAGSVDVASQSGSVEALAVGAASVRVGRGTVVVGLARAGDVSIEVHSGSVEVIVPAGVRPACDLASRSGAVRGECEPGEDGRIHVRTGSGTVTVRTGGRGGGRGGG